jgi:hypothetical protein
MYSLINYLIFFCFNKLKILILRKFKVNIIILLCLKNFLAIHLSFGEKL